MDSPKLNPGPPCLTLLHSAGCRTGSLRPSLSPLDAPRRASTVLFHLFADVFHLENSNCGHLVDGAVASFSPRHDRGGIGGWNRLCSRGASAYGTPGGKHKVKHGFGNAI
jgi:hypothetical protein